MVWDLGWAVLVVVFLEAAVTTCSRAAMVVIVAMHLVAVNSVVAVVVVLEVLEYRELTVLTAR